MGQAKRTRQFSAQALRVLGALYAKPGQPYYGLELSKLLDIKAGSLHPLLASLESQGWVESSWEEIDERVEGRRRRKYYQAVKSRGSAVKNLLEAHVRPLLDALAYEEEDPYKNITRSFDSSPLSGIHVGDAFDLINRVPDKSVDLIFTDPIYTRLEDYRWLERVAARKLKPEGNVLAFQSGYHLAKTLQYLKTDLPVLSAVQQTNGNLAGHTIAKSYHLVWLGSGLTGLKPNGKRRFVPDGYVSNTWSKANTHTFKWTKNPLYIRTIMSSFVNPGALVLDPFCGGGTVPAVAKALGMNYLGFELNPERAELAVAACGEGQADLADTFARADELKKRRTKRVVSA